MHQNNSKPAAPVDADNRITPLFNDAFLRIFGGPDSTPLTRSLVNAVLRRAGIPEIAEVSELRADTTSPGGVRLKSPRTDVLVVAEDGRFVDLEAERTHADVGNKLQYYAARTLVDNTPKGDNTGYHRVPQAMGIMLLEDRKLYPGRREDFAWACIPRWEPIASFDRSAEEARRVAGVVPQDAGVVTQGAGTVPQHAPAGERSGDADAKAGEKPLRDPDRTLLVVVELDKVRERYTAYNPEEIADDFTAWAYLLARGYQSDDEMEAIVGQFPDIHAFAEHYKLAIGDPEVRRAYDLYLESEMEYNSRVHEDVERGREEGLEQGREEGAVSMLAGLVRKGRLTLSEGAEEAGLSEEEFRERAGLE